uniref:Uncharacterized protein n=1 Tax=Curvibacter symbiont subsp. Hydra magnipapillata TaxID=667019 RepID=C9YDJ7_CURXX|nr:hypothetical protein Csp_F36940 [Curvibacter putative symbiont of Hydra magnipapillata]
MQRCDWLFVGGQLALLLGLALLPHQALLYSLFKLTLFGKNVWLMLPLGIAVAGMLVVVIRAGGALARNLLLVCAMLWIAGIWAGLYWPDAGVAEVVVNTRPLFLFPAALLAGLAASRDACFQRWFLCLVLLQGVVQALVGLLHVHVFPQVVTGTGSYVRGLAYFVTEEWALFTSREAGTLGNPSAYAEMISVAGFAACYLVALQTRRLGSLPTLAGCLGLWLLLVAAVVPSLSRMAMVYVSMPFLVLLATQVAQATPETRRLLLVLVPAVLSVMVLVTLLGYPQLLDRYRLEGMYGRTQKNVLLANALFSDWNYFFFGVPAELLKSLRTPEGLGFGDNSYLRLAAATGIPLFCAWLGLNLRIWHHAGLGRMARPVLQRLHWVLLSYLLVLLYLGDVLFNDGWLLMCAMLLAARPPEVAAEDPFTR